MNKLNIAVLFGGCSSEYSISLESAYAVISHINQELYQPVMIGITKDGTWYYFEGDIEKIANNTWCNEADCTRAILSPNRTVHELILLYQNDTKAIPIDAAFPVLHGKNGEDGTLQGMLELADIAIVGCKTLASALCMDKDKAHRLARLAGVLVPESYVLELGRWQKTELDQINKIGYPLFVKPVKAGSSYGVTRVLRENELSDAINLAFTFDNQVIIEKAIEGFEVGCAIMGNEEYTIGEVDEIDLAKGFFDFDEKYSLKTSVIHVPARISEEKSSEIKEKALIIYKALGCRGFARVDLFLTPSGEIVFNEVNTIPGFTAHSRFPSMMKAIGITFEQIISKVIELAVKE
jgi:D-alanine---D-serine ligase